MKTAVMMMMVVVVVMMMTMMVLCPKAGSLAFTPPGNEMSEVVSRCLPHRQLSKVATWLAARTGFEPATVRSTGIDYTNAPPSPIIIIIIINENCSRHAKFSQYVDVM